MHAAPRPLTVCNVRVPHPGAGHSGPWNGAARWDAAAGGSSVGPHSSLPGLPAPILFSRKERVTALPSSSALSFCVLDLTGLHVTRPLTCSKPPTCVRAQL